MKKYCFIGYGSMAKMLIAGFLETAVLKPEEIVVATRTKSKLLELADKWPGVNAAANNGAAVQESKYIFLCVKPLEIKGVMEEIRPYLGAETHVISIAACVTLADLGTVYQGQITKAIPTFISAVGEGITLLCHNSKVSPENKNRIEKLFGTLSTVKNIREENFEIAADLTSCAVGFIAAIAREFVAAGVRQSTLSRSEAEEMVRKTVYGTAKLFAVQDSSFNEIIARVATPGGITEEGVKVLQKGLPFVFDTVLEKTLAKHDGVKGLVGAQFKRK
ncbi:MAG: pyrroline-5-carboxylate reductase dimerization domain-containing protein [Peptococcaceae bacterium]